LPTLLSLEIVGAAAVAATVVRRATPCDAISCSCPSAYTNLTLVYCAMYITTDSS
jgi:hypothetical protein